MIRNAVFTLGKIPYFEEKRFLRKASFLMVRKVIFARGGFPYFDESQITVKITNCKITLNRGFCVAVPSGKVVKPLFVR